MFDFGIEECREQQNSNSLEKVSKLSSKLVRSTLRITPCVCMTVGCMEDFLKSRTYSMNILVLIL